MSGFRHCSWCHGQGCMCCDTERAKWEKAEAERQEKHANRTPDEIRQSLTDLRWIRHGGPIEGVSLGAQLAVASAGRNNLHMDEIDAEIAREEALLDAEYRQQFPDGPKPIMTIQRGDEMEIGLLQHAFSGPVLEKAFRSDGGGMAEIMDRVAEANSLQALHRKAEEAAEKSGD